ncbi:MAG: NfeD family protein [Bacteroidaceae bacterium]|nr:NfeD family protein [Bacteroidaceae bacterium]
MLESFSSLPLTLQVFWGCAIFSSAFFILQTAMTLIGIGGDGADFDTPGGDIDISHAGIAGEAMQMFSFRNFINFLLGFGWGGVCLAPHISSTFLLTIAAAAIGLAFVVLFIIIFKQLLKLEHSGNIDLLRDVIGKEADVYLIIRPGERGKVQLSINGSVREYSAVSENNDITIPTGARVRITGLTGPDSLTVVPI